MRSHAGLIGRSHVPEASRRTYSLHVFCRLGHSSTHIASTTMAGASAPAQTSELICLRAVKLPIASLLQLHLSWMAALTPSTKAWITKQHHALDTPDPQTRLTKHRTQTPFIPTSEELAATCDDVACLHHICMEALLSTTPSMFLNPPCLCNV